MSQWDAHAYHRVSGPMEAMGVRVLDRLPLSGDETVIDAGCGTGRVTSALVERLPRGRVVAVDVDAGMVEAARSTLAPYGERVEVHRVDLLELTVDVAGAPVDAVLSTATFHWVLDHDLLFRRIFDVLRPGGVLVAQCGGAGNIASLLRAAGEVMRRAPYTPWFEGWSRATRYESDEATATRLLAAGFGDVTCWLEPNPVEPDDPHDYLRTIMLSAHVARLPDELRDPFVSDVCASLPAPLVVDYVRLNIDARRL